MKRLAWLARDDSATNPPWLKVVLLVIAIGVTVSVVFGDLVPLLNGEGSDLLVFALVLSVLFLTNYFVARMLDWADFFKILFVMSIGISVSGIIYLSMSSIEDGRWRIILAFFYPAILIFVILATDHKDGKNDAE